MGSFPRSSGPASPTKLTTRYALTLVLVRIQCHPVGTRENLARRLWDLSLSYVPCGLSSCPSLAGLAWQRDMWELVCSSSSGVGQDFVGALLVSPFELRRVVSWAGNTRGERETHTERERDDQREYTHPPHPLFDSGVINSAAWP